MPLEKIKQEMVETLFQEQIDKHYSFLLGMLGEVVEKGKLPVWHQGNESDPFVDELEKLGLVETFSYERREFYRPTQKGMSVYKQHKKEHDRAQRNIV